MSTWRVLDWLMSSRLGVEQQGLEGNRDHCWLWNILVLLCLDLLNGWVHCPHVDMTGAWLAGVFQVGIDSWKGTGIIGDGGIFWTCWMVGIIVPISTWRVLDWLMSSRLRVVLLFKRVVMGAWLVSSRLGVMDVDRYGQTAGDGSSWHGLLGLQGR